ncbi:unnamed protein product [Echinostoma caproni]|uniref:Transmembrane protein 60 n=1 Tax=Echinostoma caproni TaxID=27848 RepID=A0A183AY19_9TREM|nr:unnamed protein product [Echinostoma caproni]
MRLLNKPIILWVVVSIFFLMVMLRMNETIFWNWFVIFTPMWFLDLVMLITVCVCISHRNIRLTCSCDPGTRTDQVLSFVLITSKLLAQITICLYAERSNFGTGSAPEGVWTTFRLWHVMIPLWLTLSLTLVALCRGLFGKALHQMWSRCAHF